MYKVNEIFVSIQGEGYRVGRLAVFVRFSGCPKTCSFCDTRHDTWEDFTLQALLKAISDQTRLIGHNVDCVLTGGEPLLQVDLPLFESLVALGFHVCVETSADSSIELSANFSALKQFMEDGVLDVTVSPKDTEYSKAIMRRAMCVKVLCPLLFHEEGLNVLSDVLHDGYHDVHRVLQPISPVKSDILWQWRAACTEALTLAKHRKIHYNEQWRVIPQVHEIMNFR